MAKIVEHPVVGAARRSPSSQPSSYTVLSTPGADLLFYQQSWIQLIHPPRHRLDPSSFLRPFPLDGLLLLAPHHHRWLERLLFSVARGDTDPSRTLSPTLTAFPRQDNDPIPFASLGVDIKNVHKTGLGSSAAMVSSLTSALLLHWDSRSSLKVDKPEPTVLSASPPRPALFPKPARLEMPDKDTLALIHNLAQYVHSLAQGKVGSGFDVSAAVYGSHVYRRFAVECLGSLLSGESNEKVSWFLLFSSRSPGADALPHPQITGQSLLKTLSPLHNPLWTTNPTSALVSPFGLPPGVILILADVDAGSNTPSMVGKVLAWKKAQPEEGELDPSNTG